jgi:hypothetical protein
VNDAKRKGTRLTDACIRVRGVARAEHAATLRMMAQVPAAQSAEAGIKGRPKAPSGVKSGNREKQPAKRKKVQQGARKPPKRER